MWNHGGTLDPTFSRRLIIGLGVTGAVWAGYTISENPIAAFSTLVVGAYVLTLTVNYRALAWLLLALHPAALIVPHFRGRPFLWELCAVLAWPSLIAYFLVNRERMKQLRLDRFERGALFSLAGYLLVLVMLMSVRGVGFRVLGGEQMGGRFYVQQLALAIIPLLLITAALSRRALITAVGTGWLMALTYLISDFSFSLGGPVWQYVLYFVELPTDALNFESGYSLTGMRRYQSLSACGSSLLAALWVLFPLRTLLGGGALWGIPLVLAGLGLGLGSGHRTLLVISLLTLFLLMCFQRYWNPLRTVAAVAGVAVLLGLLYANSERLPEAIQRAVSFLPGIEVSDLAREDASATLNDRIEVLKLAWNDAPRYWLVGRGFGMERLDLVPPDPLYAGVWLQYVNGLFYNGTVGLFLKTGLPGLVFTLIFTWYVSRMAVELVGAVRRVPAERQGIFERLCLLTAANWFSMVFFFYLTHGDAGSWLQIFGLLAVPIMACRRRLVDDAEPEPAAAGPGA